MPSGPRGGAPRRAPAAARWVFALSLIAGLLPAASPLAETAPTPPDDYGQLWTALTRARPDPSRVASVASLILERDAGTLVLEQGVLALAEPVAGRIVAAVFVGKGTFQFTPPNAIEAEQLERHFGVRSLRREFDRLALFFADSTAMELESAAPFGAGEVPREAADALKDAFRWISGSKDSSLDVTLARALLEGRRDGTFIACIAGRDPLLFEIDPASGEEVRLIRRVEEVASRGRRLPQEIVSQFRLGGRPSEELASDSRPWLGVRRYRISAAFADDHSLRAAAELDAEVLEEGSRHLHFYLHPELRVDSVSAQGVPLRFFRAREGASLWAALPARAARGDSMTVRIRYHGKVIEREGDWFRLKNSILWYPWHDPFGRARFDLTFEHDKGHQLVSVGQRASSETRGRRTTSRWVTPYPIRNASFTIGIFNEHTVEAKDLPAVTVLRSKTDRHELVAELADQGVAPGAGMERQVAADVVNSYAFFRQVYGALPLEHLYVSEDPAVRHAQALHGQAFPGLIWLGTGTFMATRSGGEDELLRAHEVAHQWWPMHADYQTYHDRWLSEAFAEFSGLWFLQMTRRDNKRYFNMLEAWRKEILQNRKFLLGSGQEAGPIWLGHRTGTSTTEGDDFLIVYHKGAWVLHMLRNLLLDLDTMSESRFLEMMRQFFDQHRGGTASTESFRRVAESHAGQDLGWFFRQWVYGTKVPSYRFAWKAEDAGEGRFRVRCRVEQQGVPEDFRMQVPLRVEFEGGEHARVRANVQGPVAEFDLPLLPKRPQRVVFNDLMSVLCAVEEVPWR